MGLVQSIFCSITFCVERVLTWSCCAFLLMLLMFTLIVLMVYGISVGYHYAQKELASFAMSSRSTTETSIENRRAGGGGLLDEQPVVRLVAVNRSKAEGPQRPLLEVAEDPHNRLYLETSATPIILLETERAPAQPELSPNEREFAKRLIGRFRRSRNATTTAEPFLRPLRSALTTELLTFVS